MRDLLCSPNSRPAWVPHWQEVPSSALLALARQGVDFLPDALVLWIHISLVIVLEGAQFDCDCKRKALAACPCVHEQILEIAIQLAGRRHRRAISFITRGKRSGRWCGRRSCAKDSSIVLASADSRNHPPLVIGVDLSARRLDSDRRAFACFIRFSSLSNPGLTVKDR